jgi:hypothetical protein
MRKHYPLFIPLIMLLLSVLACDSMPYSPMHVSAIEADPTLPGTAYILVEGFGGYYAEDDKNVTQAYETHDYGEHWEVSDHSLTDWPEKNYELPLQINDETLSFNDKALWTYPHATFRYFFYNEDSDNLHPQLGGGINSVSADQEVIYVGMGTEGVLVGPNLRDPMDRQWKLTNQGISLLKPIQLTITDPNTIMLVTLAGLLIPPLSLIHTYLLSQVYRYAFPPEKSRKAWVWAVIVTGVITILAACAVAIWLTDINYDFYPIVAIMTAICCLLGGGIGFFLVIRRKSVYGFAWKFVLMSVLASLVVPLGVASVWFAWFAIFSSVIGFALFRRYLEQYIAYTGNDVPYWQLDKAALRQVPTGIIMVPIMTLFSLMLLGVVDRVVQGGSWIGILCFIGGAIFIFWKLFFTDLVSEKVPKDKKTGGLTEAIEEIDNPFRDEKFAQARGYYLFGWLLLSMIASVAVFCLQMWAHIWFRTLLLNQ